MVCNKNGVTGWVGKQDRMNLGGRPFRVVRLTRKPVREGGLRCRSRECQADEKRRGGLVDFIQGAFLTTADIKRIAWPKC